jgi:hypothetical protein
LIDKYPRLISVLVILALICTTGLAIFLISDLVYFASNSDYKGASVGLDLKGPENGILPMSNDKENRGNISTNSSQSLVNTSRQTNVDKKSGNAPVIRHHSSSSSSSSKSSSANSAKKSSSTNNLTNETATIPMPTNQSMNNSQQQESVFLNANRSVSLPQIDAANGTITSSDLSREGQSSFIDPAKNTPAREPVSIIEFKTETSLSPKSDQGLSSDSGASTDGASVSDNANKAKSSKVLTKNIKLKTTKTKSASSKNSKLTAASQAAKVKEARDEMKANKDRIEQNMKKKAAQLRSKAA